MDGKIYVCNAIVINIGNCLIVNRNFKFLNMDLKCKIHLTISINELSTVVVNHKQLIYSKLSTECACLFSIS